MSYNGQATLTWGPNSDSDLADYKIYVGSAPRFYDSSRTLVTTGLLQVVTGLDNGLTWYFTIAARDLSGNESTFSAEVSKLVTVSVLNLLRTIK